MKTTTLRKFGLATLLIAATAPSLALAKGTDNGGGCAGFARSYHAFFVSPNALEPVTACIEAAPDFGIPTDAVQKMIESSFKKWADYIVEKDIYFGAPSALYAQTHLVMRPKCQGDENLTVYLGVENDMIRDYREKSGEDNLFGLAQLTQKRVDEWQSGNSEKVETQQARGFIWIAPQNSIDPDLHIPTWASFSAPALEGLLLHEIGHVFGNAEFEGTVMTPLLAKFLMADTRPGSHLENLPYYFKIDSQVELVPCLRCSATYLADSSRSEMQYPNQQYISDSDYTFNKLTGQIPTGPVTMKFERKKGLSPGSGYLTVSDSKIQARFLIEVRYDNMTPPDNTPLFTDLGGIVHHSQMASYQALVLTTDRPAKDLFVVTVNYNVDSKKLVIKEWVDIRSPDRDFVGRTLFRSAD